MKRTPRLVMGVHAWPTSGSPRRPRVHAERTRVEARLKTPTRADTADWPSVGRLDANTANIGRPKVKRDSKK